MKKLFSDELVQLGGIPFIRCRMADVIERIENVVKFNQTGRQIITVNADILLQAQRDCELMAIIKESWMNTADGMPIIWMSRLLGEPLPERVTGADLTIELCRLGKDKGFRLFFLGAADGVAERARDIVNRSMPQADIRGVYSPSAEELQNHERSLDIVNRINNSGANILLVAFGAPKQEKWIYRYSQLLNPSVSIGVGASIDFLAGTVPRAPEWMQRAGMEWSYRLAKEPRRLWKRYLNDTAIFVLATREWLKARRRRIT